MMISKWNLHFQKLIFSFHVQFLGAMCFGFPWNTFFKSRAQVRKLVGPHRAAFRTGGGGGG